MTFTNVFGGSTVQPSDVSFVAITLSTANAQLVWPSAYVDTGTAIGRIVDVTPTGGGFSVNLPDATQVSTGQDVLFRNLGSNTFVVYANDGITAVASVSAGQAYYCYLTNNSTAAGSWTPVLFGVGSSSLTASAIAGYGLTAIGATLNLASPVSTHASSYTVAASDRASTLVFTGGGDVWTCPTASTIGNDFMALVKNGGTGALVLSAADTIDGGATVTLNPNESLILVCSGTVWWTVGAGKNANYVLAQNLQSVAGNSDVTLTSAQSACQVQKYTGILTGNINVIVPALVQVYYVTNVTTGSFTLTVKTASGTGIEVGQNTRTILYCDGTNVVRAISTNSTTPGTYSFPVITIDAYGMITAISSGTSSAFYPGTPASTSQAVSAGLQYLVDTTSAPITFTLPSSPAVGDRLYIVDAAGKFATNALTIAPGGGLNVYGSAQNLVSNTNWARFGIEYSSVTQGWIMVP